jgi:hypothetical protein
LLGANFCKILGKCGWSNAFTQNKSTFHFFILETCPKSILLKTHWLWH